MRHFLCWLWRYQILARTSPRREGMNWQTYRRLYVDRAASTGTVTRQE